MIDINELYYGDYVSVDQELFIVLGSDSQKKTAFLAPIELLDRYAQDSEQLEANAISVSARKICRINPVQVDESVIRSLFRLEVTPWTLVGENKYPFSVSTGKYSFTEEDFLCFIDNLGQIKSNFAVIAWNECFGYNGGYNFAKWPKQTEPGFSFYFLCKEVRYLMDYLDSIENDSEELESIFELRDCYLKSKGRKLSETIVPDDFKGEMLSCIEEYAEKHEITDEIREYYAALLDEAAGIDDELGFRKKGYAYYGGNKFVPCNWKKSEEALLQAFDIGKDPYVANSLGYIYYSDRLGVPDYEKALYYFKYAAGDGVTEATYKLSDMYRKGHGVKKDPVQAWNLLMSLRRWINKKDKSKDKYPDIMLRIGYCYRDGIGVEGDNDKALEYFYEAKEGIELRIKKHVGFGDEVVLRNVLQAIESVKDGAHQA